MDTQTRYSPAKTSHTRVFIIEGRARPDRKPTYASQLKMTGISKSFGEITKIEIPDPDVLGKFIEVDQLQGSDERATTSLVGRFAAALKSELLRIGSAGKKLDVQLHIGASRNPSDPNTFSKNIIMEDVLISDYSSDDLGALESGENAKIDETANISATKMYEVVPLSFSKKAGDKITNEIIGIAIHKSSDESVDQPYVFALTKAAGGSPSTPADVLYSLDGGNTWSVHDVDTLEPAEEPDAIGVLGDYVFVLSKETASLMYAPISDFVAEIDPTFSEVAGGATFLPNAVATLARDAYIVCDDGYIFYMDDPTAGVSVLDAGVATSDDLLAVDAYSKDAVVAVGANGAVVYSTDGINWQAVSNRPVGMTVNLTGVAMLSERVWIVTASNGKMYFTVNGGEKWFDKVPAGTAPSAMNAIQFATDTVGFCVGIVGGKGRAWRTFDGGYSWTVLPENVGSFPTVDSLTCIAVHGDNPDTVFFGGIDSGTDGVIVLGTD